MKIKLLFLVVLIVGVLAFGVTRTASTIQKENPPYKDRLKWYAKEAKTHGQQKIKVPAPLVEYLGGASTITSDEAFASSTVLIAHLVSQESYPRDDDIITWNKFAIEEVLSEAQKLPCPACVPADAPSTLLPLQSGEFLIPKTGGTVNIDGVVVEQTDNDFPAYEFNQRYLLLVSLYPPGVARTMGGPVGVFTIGQNGNLKPVRENGHRIRKDFREKYGDSLENVKSHFKRL